MVCLAWLRNDQAATTPSVLENVFFFIIIIVYYYGDFWAYHTAVF